MKCHSCHKRCVKESNYCKRCGYQFSLEEKKKALEPVWILKIIKKIYECITLQIITDDIRFKVGYVLGVLILGFYMLFTTGLHIRILKSDIYTVEYNEKVKEYYVLVNNYKNVKQVDLQVYIPNKVDKLALTYYDNSNNVLSNTKYNKKDKISLEVNDNSNNYYIISDTKNSKEKLKVFVYNKNVLKEGTNYEK